MTRQSCDIAFAISAGEFGGAEYYVQLLSEQCADRGLNVAFIGQFENPRETQFDYRPLRIGPKWSRSTVFRSAANYLRERNRYLAALKSVRPKVLHVQFKREQIMLTARASRTTRVVWTEHGVFPTGAFGRVLGVLYRRASRHASEIICVSNAVRESLVNDVRIDPTKLTVISNAADLQEFRPSAERRDKARSLLGLADETVLLTLSRLEFEKGIDRAVDMMRHLPANYRLLIAGDGSEIENLRQLAAPLGDRVRLLGFIPDVSSLIAAADMFVFPSRPGAREGTPISILQAMAGGLPLIVTNDAGVESLVLEAEAEVVGSDDPARMAAAAAAVSSDLERRSECSLAHAARFDVRPWAARTIEALAGR